MEIPENSGKPGLVSLYGNLPRHLQSSQADVAQLVEQSIRNRQVIGSSPIVGSIFSIAYRQSVHHLLHNCCTLEFFLELFHRIHGVFTGRLDVKALSRADAFMPENGLNGSVGHA